MTPSCDISDPESLQRALDECRSQTPPFKGCVQAAMVLRDALFEAMSNHAWQEALASKVQGSWNLHNQLPSGMDFFFMLSSIAGIIGIRGQTNYAAGNTFQDALARYRVGQGEKATAVDLGVIGFTGAVVDDARLHEKFMSQSILAPITEPEIHALLDLYCNPQLASPSPSSALTCQTTVRISPNLDKAGPEEAAWLNKPMLRHLHLQNGFGGSGNNKSNTSQIDGTNIAMVLNSAQSLAEVNEAVSYGLTARLSKALSIAVEKIDADKPLPRMASTPWLRWNFAVGLQRSCRLILPCLIFWEVPLLSLLGSWLPVREVDQGEVVVVGRRRPCPMPYALIITISHKY